MGNRSLQRGHPEHGHMAPGVSPSTHPAGLTCQGPAGDPGCRDMDVVECFVPFSLVGLGVALNVSPSALFVPVISQKACSHL